MRITLQLFQPGWYAADVAVIDRYINRGTRARTVPIERRLNQIVPQEAGPARDQHPAPGDLGEFLGQIGTKILQIVFNNLLRREALGRFGHGNRVHEMGAPLRVNRGIEVLVLLSPELVGKPTDRKLNVSIRNELIFGYIALKIAIF